MSAMGWPSVSGWSCWKRMIERGSTGNVVPLNSLSFALGLAACVRFVWMTLARLSWMNSHSMRSPRSAHTITPTLCPASPLYCGMTVGGGSACEMTPMAWQPVRKGRRQKAEGRITPGNKRNLMVGTPRCAERGKRACRCLLLILPSAFRLLPSAFCLLPSAFPSPPPVRPAQVDEDLPPPRGDADRYGNDHIVTGRQEAHQTVDGFARRGDVDPRPERARRGRREQRSHRLDVQAGENVAADEPGEARRHPAAGAREAARAEELTLGQPELAVRFHSRAIGTDRDGRDQHAEAH